MGIVKRFYCLGVASEIGCTRIKISCRFLFSVVHREALVCIEKEVKLTILHCDDEEGWMLT